MAVESPIDKYLGNVERINSLLNLSAELFRQAQDVAAERLLPQRNVVKWLRSPNQILLLTVVTLLMVTSIAKLVLFLGRDFLPIDPQFRTLALSSGGIYIVEAGLLILITLYVVGKGNRDDEAINNTSLTRGFRAENRFFAYWPMLWASWFSLYALLGVNEINPINSPYFSAAANFLNNLSAMFMLGMFIELTEKTADRPNRNAQQIWLPTLMFLIVLLVAESLLYARGFLVAGVAYVFGLISGLMVGVVTGLLIAKLSSRLFNFPVSALAILTLFAVVQPVFPVLTAQPAAATDLEIYSRTIGYFAAFLALYAKIVLLVAVEWMRDRYGVLYYMVNQARMFENERELHMSDSFRLIVERLIADKPIGTPVRKFPNVRQ